MQVSAPFASRELNGELLLEELGQLRSAQVGQAQLNECVLALGALEGLRSSEAAVRLRQLAGGRFQRQPALAGLLVRWAARLKSDLDVAHLVSHLRRLALVAAVTGVMPRVADRLAARKGRA